jgi:hypothetical protein
MKERIENGIDVVARLGLRKSASRRFKKNGKIIILRMPRAKMGQNFKRRSYAIPPLELIYQ